MRRPSRESLRATLWLWPVAAGAAALLLAGVLLHVRTGLDEDLWPGGHDAATATLQTIATAVITATSLTFSLVVVALQLASQQFSPRLLREFARDRVIQAVLAVLVGTFVYCVAVLRSIDPEAHLPAAAVLTASVLGVVSAAALVGFLGHIARAIRVDSMMVAVHADTRAVMERGYPRLGEPGARPPGRDHPAEPGTGTPVLAHRSGFLASVAVDRLVASLADSGAFVRLSVRPGDHVTRGTPVGSAWPVDGALDLAVVSRGVQEALTFGYERTFEQDVAFGFRQLSDIAVKALSPGINDPTTAAHAVGYAADLLCDLQDRQVGPAVFDDRDGTPRLLMPDRDHRYYLDLAIGQVRRYAAREPAVLVALLALLRDTAVTATSVEQRDEIRRQVQLVLGEVDPALTRADAESVEDAARRVHQALEGDAAGAFEDRSGETRSV